MATTPFRFLQRRTSTSGRTPEIESLLSGELYLQLADETIYFRNDKNELVAVITDGDKFSLDKIKFTGASSGDIAVWNGSKFTPYGIANLAANLNTGVLSSVFASINHNHTQYVSTGSTGSFITTSMTGAFGGGGGGNVDLSSYITTGQTGDFVTTSQTGAFAPTGSYVVASQTGNFLTNNDTGIFANVFAPTGDYVEIIDNRVPAQYLPSYVDDILEFGSIQDFCTQAGSPNNIYVISGCNSFWRWGSSQYVEIFASPGTSDSIPEGINNLYFTNERSACYVLKTQTGNFIKDSQTGIFANIFAPNGNYALASQTGNFVTKSQTGNFIHTSMICAFSGGSGVDLTNYVSVSQTGDLINVFAPTGDYVTASQTGAFASIGNYVTTSQTGDFITSSQTGAFAPTGDYVLANQTGNFIVSSQTGEFAPTGNYVEIIDGRVPAQYLPSYVDNVLEFGNIQDFCNQCGNVNNIYVISGCSSFWRWGSSQYVEIFASPGTSDSVPEGINNLYFTNQRSTCYVAKTQTGCFVTAAQTGTLTSVFAATGNYVFNSQTGILTNAFAPTGNYVQTVCGQIPAQYLPSYVDEITGSACVQNFCNQNGNPNYIYTVSGCNSFWRWDGSKYVEIFASPGTSDSVAEGINNLYFTTQRSACYVAKTETGSFITTSMTGAFAVGGEYVTVSQTGDLTGAFAPSGSYVTTSQTGQFAPSGSYVTTSQTGQFAPSGSYVTTSQTGQFAPSGNYATIVDGLVPAQYLPAYVDQILEFGSIQDFCTQNGNSNYIYVISGCNSFWRWGSSQYVEIFASPGTSDSIPEGINNLYFTNQRSACYVAKTQTGCFITAAQTGTLTNVFAATGNYVLNSQTGILTTAFAPTGNYVQTVCGQVPAQYLPSYVDEIVGFACVQDFCNQNGNSNYVYIVSGCNSFWRWGGSQYVEIFASPGTSDSVAEGINNLYFTVQRSACYVAKTETGSFITTSMTGAFAVGGEYVTVSQTGELTGAFAPTGDYVIANQTGNFITVSQTGAFAPTGNYVQIIDGRVPSQYLPSYVDEVLIFGSIEDFCNQCGDINSIYSISGCNSFWRWGSSQYVEIFASPGTSDSVAEGINNLYFTTERSACYVVKTQTGCFVTATQTGTLANVFASTGNYILNSQTGILTNVFARTGNYVQTICGRVPAQYLPSYVDEIFAFGSIQDFCNQCGSSNNIYVISGCNSFWRWGGSQYVEIFASPGTSDSVVEGINNLYFTAERSACYVSTGQTGSFITTSMTGAFAVGGEYVTASQTGELTGAFASTGDYVTTSQTGAFAPTGDYVVASATGSFVTTSQTGAFAPTGDYVFTNQTGNFVTTSQTGSFASINGGYLLSSQIPTITGDVCIIAGSNNALICKIQGYPVSNAAPINGQTLQFNGTSWVPGDIPAGGNGGGGLIYYFNNSVAPDSPTANLPASISGTFELGRSGVSNQLAIQKTNLLTSFESIVGFVTDVLDPSTEAIPAGLFDFNIWASSNSATEVLFQIKVYKYNGSNSPTLLATSNDVYTYDNAAVSQYAASVILPQTTLSTNDRLYVELLARALNNNHSITFYFGGNTPSHIHTTVPSVGGSGLVKVINGVTQSKASLITNSDISGSAAIDASKIQSGVFALCSETGIFETTGYARNCYVTTGETGVFALSTNTGNFVTASQTGQFTSINVCEFMPYSYQLQSSGSIINGGCDNFSGAQYSTILGGVNNHISGSCISYSTVLNNLNNTGVIAMTYGSGIYIITACSGKLFTSNNGLNWTEQNSSFETIDTISALTYGSGLFVAGGNRAKIATSNDGINWTQRVSNFTSPASTVICGLSYVGNCYIAVGTQGNASFSSDGIEWTNRNVFFGTCTINTASYGNGLFVLGGQCGRISVSSDAINWTMYTITALGNTISNSISCIIYENSLFVGASNGRIATSVDGINWTLRANPFSSLSTRICALAYYANTYYAAGASSPRLATSTDGINWFSVTNFNPLFENAGAVSDIAVGCNKLLFGGPSLTGRLVLAENAFFQLNLIQNSQNSKLIKTYNSTILNGINSCLIEACNSTILNGVNSCLVGTCNSTILNGVNSCLVGTCNSTIIGSGITGNSSNTTYVDNLKINGIVSGNGAGLTGLNVTGTGYLQTNSVVENFIFCNTGAGSTSAIDYDLISTSTLYYFCDSVANFCLNFRGNSTCTLNALLPVNNTISSTFLFNSSSSASHCLTGISVDGVSQAIRWAGGGGSPTTALNATNSYSITIAKTGNGLYSTFASYGFFS